MMTDVPLIIIAAALSMEIEELTGNLKRVSPWLWQGKYGRHEIQVMKTGVGKDKVQKTLRKANLKDCLVINIGWAGALQPYLRVGSIVAAKKIYEVSQDGLDRSVDFTTSGDFAPVDVPEAEMSEAADQLFCGTLLTISRPADREEKQELVRRYPEALAVDMESFYMAEFCQKRQIPFLVLRSISDTVGFRLPSGQNGGRPGDKQAGERQAVEDQAGEKPGIDPWLNSRFREYCRQASRSNVQMLNFYLNHL